MKRVALLVLCLAMLLGVTACGTSIPDVKGMSADEATRVLDSAGFGVGKVSYDETSTEEPGRVIAQSPSAGERAKASSLVALTISGPPPVVVPDLANLDEKTARAALNSVGLSAGQVTTSYDATVTAGTLISQDPAPQATVPRGSTVALLFSKGPAPVDIPRVIGKTERAAIQALEAVGFRTKIERKSNEAKKGTVIGQSPKDKKAQPGALITLTISTGVEMVRVPNIEGMVDPDPTLRRAGLNPKGIAIHGPIESDAAGIGEAYRQRPRPGSIVPKGTTVTYHFWWESG